MSGHRAEISRQNANLHKVKQQLASDAKRVGANTVIHFKYGQRAHNWYTHIFDLTWDSESWYGESDAGGQATECVSTGNLEAEILSCVK
jgi:hypothetical protein